MRYPDGGGGGTPMAALAVLTWVKTAYVDCFGVDGA
jgi:hypothetical protein